MEYVIWGKCPESPDDEIVLISNAGSMARAQAVMNALSLRHGCFDMRVQVLDLSTPPNFVK
jgi:hypothetical protein